MVGNKDCTLSFSMLGKTLAENTKILFLFCQKIGFDISCKFANLHEMSNPSFYSEC